MTVEDLYEVSREWLIEKETGKRIKFQAQEDELDLEEIGKEHVMFVEIGERRVKEFEFPVSVLVVSTYERN